MSIVERLIGTLAPHQCLVCGNEGSLLCAWCLPDAIEPLPARCYKCKEQSNESAVCKKCRRNSPLKHVWVRAQYKHVAKQLVYRLKFSHTPAAAAPIAELLGESLPWMSPDTIVVHVPTATSRRRQRGFDHSELIAKQLARFLGLRHCSLVARYGHTRQVGAKRKERLTQLKDAFYPRQEYLIKNASILLIDDIVTTGSTVEEAAKILKQAGAKRIDAAIFAQKQ